MTPSYWIIVGVVLLLVEMTTPGLVSIFFGLSALIVALLSWLIPMSPTVQWLIFALLAVVLLVALRKWAKTIFAGHSSQAKGLDNEIVGQQVVVTKRIEVGHPGKVELRGANWSAEATETIEPGVPVKVVKQDSITLTVERV